MVVQCPNCQTKFRIADDKVTEKGVRVRCTSCKNVFQVKKTGIENAAAQAPGQTQELQALSAAQLASNPPANRPATIPPAPRTGATNPAMARPPSSGSLPPRPSTVPPPPRAATGSSAPAIRAPGNPTPPPPRPPSIPPGPGQSRGPISLSTASAPGAVGRRRASAFSLEGEGEEELPGPPPPPPPAGSRPRPSADDLFGMHELTGESTALPGSPLSSNPNLRFKPPTLGSSPPPPPSGAAEIPPPPPDEEVDNSEPTDGTAPVKLAAVKTIRKEVFEEPLELADGKPAKGERSEREAATLPPPAPDPSLQRPVQRELVAVAATGLIGISLALALVAVISFANLTPRWMHEGPTQPVVTTQIASGLYDISSTKPVFFVRGRVENRGTRAVGPVRVVADLLGDSGAVARAETVAGTEPSAEDLHALRSVAEADAMAKTLARAGADKRLGPGESMPFFALISDPPAGAERDELRLRVEAKEAH